MTRKTVPVAQLVEDLSIYPRQRVDDMWVGRIAEALRAGVKEWKGGPVVVEKRSMRIIDGWHRVRATRRVLGENAEIEVDERTYPDELAVLEAAYALNKEHGKALAEQDRRRFAVLAQANGMPDDRIQLVIGVSEEKLKRLILRVSPAPPSAPRAITFKMLGDDKDTAGAVVPLKHSVSHLAGITLTAEQAAAVASAPGTSYLLLSAQLIGAIEHDLLDRTNEPLMASLTVLHERLDKFLAVVA